MVATRFCTELVPFWSRVVITTVSLFITAEKSLDASRVPSPLCDGGRRDWVTLFPFGSAEPYILLPWLLNMWWEKRGCSLEKASFLISRRFNIPDQSHRPLGLVRVLCVHHISTSIQFLTALYRRVVEGVIVVAGLVKLRGLFVCWGGSGRWQDIFEAIPTWSIHDAVRGFLASISPVSHKWLPLWILIKLRWCQKLRPTCRFEFEDLTAFSTAVYGVLLIIWSERRDVCYLSSFMFLWRVLVSFFLFEKNTNSGSLIASASSSTRSFNRSGRQWLTFP